MDVRIAQGGERDAALAVWHRANVTRNLVPTTARIARVKEKIEDDEAVVLVAVLEGDVVGMGLMQSWQLDDGTGPVDEARGHISMLFVDPTFTSIGVGKAVLSELIAEAGRRGWSTVSLWTRSTNERARRLYERSGFTTTGNIKAFADDDILEYLRKA